MRQNVGRLRRRLNEANDHVNRLVDAYQRRIVKHPLWSIVVASISGVMASKLFDFWFSANNAASQALWASCMALFKNPIPCLFVGFVGTLVVVFLLAAVIVWSLAVAWIILDLFGKLKKKLLGTT